MSGVKVGAEVRVAVAVGVGVNDGVGRGDPEAFMLQPADTTSTITENREGKNLMLAFAMLLTVVLTILLILMVAWGVVKLTKRVVALEEQHYD